MGSGPPAVELHDRLLARRGEIEQAILTRIKTLSDPNEVADPAYAAGLRATVSVALDYGLVAIERGEDRTPPVPAALRAQAQFAARSGIGLETVLRRYFAGYALLGDYLVEEAGKCDLEGHALKRLLRGQAVLFDRILAAVSDEHGREAELRYETTDERRAEQVQRLLDGELFDATELCYEVEATHLALIAKGVGAADVIRDVAAGLGLRLLLVRRGGGMVWAWLGGCRAADFAGLAGALSAACTGNLFLGIGEPAAGILGWRLTHQQASAALPIALRGPETIVRYSDVTLLASWLQDDLLLASLQRIYLDPLSDSRDGGAILKQTLRAYFAAERNVSSAAAALKVKRHTVTNRLRATEELLGRPLSSCAAEMDAALRLDDLSKEAPQTQSSRKAPSHG